jgi:hypothetical protein
MVQQGVRCRYFLTTFCQVSSMCPYVGVSSSRLAYNLRLQGCDIRKPLSPDSKRLHV